ncbi:hypothetical protein E1B28_007350 [Marasmius oreades]|uniref:Uncharacterized protein n=1 Tax=Marasmius oreades TaxID=181124 RepID=A0A9P7UTY2_9AGAR|nr:uncharacterized protein E1B28_007350 [Marasmius oreades]KAG7093695.1 hypothetical protein E1B28_007350 [Marasmius oreades]
MANIGSVFLGDSKRIRVFSGSTPPSSPPASATMFGVLSNMPSPTSVSQHPASAPPPEEDAPSVLPMRAGLIPRADIEPELGLELRIRWLEALVMGVNANATSAGRRLAEVKQGESLIRSANELQKALNGIIEGNDGLKRFISQYDQHAQFLTPSFALSGLTSDGPTYDNMSPSDFETYMKELENDIRSADRDMREIEALEAKGVTGAGKLADHIPLLPRVDNLLKTYAEDAQRMEALEKRISGVIESQAVYASLGNFLCSVTQHIQKHFHSRSTLCQIYL